MLYSRTLAMFAWASVFTEGWLLILRKIPSDGLAWGFFAFFFFVAVASSALSSLPKPGK